MEPGWSDSGAARQSLVGSRQRQAASEGSLLTKVVGNLDYERSWRGSEGRGENESAGKVGGGGSGHFVRENQEGIRRNDLEIGIGRSRVTWGRVIWQGLRTGLE